MASATREAPALQFDQLTFGSHVQVVDLFVAEPEAEFWFGTDDVAPVDGATMYSQLAREYRNMRIAPDRSRAPRRETG